MLSVIEEDGLKMLNPEEMKALNERLDIRSLIERLEAEVSKSHAVCRHLTAIENSLYGSNNVVPPMDIDEFGGVLMQIGQLLSYLEANHHGSLDSAKRILETFDLKSPKSL